ncbi:MAG: sugar ABC transporter permease [Protaetiibacter sp.]
MSVPAPPPPASRLPERRRRARRRNLTGWAFSAPYVIAFGAFMALPILASLAMSLTDFQARDIRSPFAVDFVGIAQYSDLLTDAAFWQSLGVTGLFIVMALPITMTVAMLLALGLNTGRGALVSIFRVGFYAPVVTSLVAVSVSWRYILQPDGLLNQALALVGIDGPNWLADPAFALPALVMMAVWRTVGTLMIIFLAGLQSIPSDVHEAALVDGASALRRTFSVTLPMLRPTLLLGAVLVTIGYVQFFEEAFVMTQGGPLGTTRSAVYYTFQEFGYGHFGTASAASYILFLIIALLALLQFRLFRTSED